MKKFQIFEGAVTSFVNDFIFVRYVYMIEARRLNNNIGIANKFFANVFYLHANFKI